MGRVEAPCVWLVLTLLRFETLGTSELHGPEMSSEYEPEFTEKL
jgi:hypothetical protein